VPVVGAGATAYEESLAETISIKAVLMLGHLVELDTIQHLMKVDQRCRKHVSQGRSPRQIAETVAASMSRHGMKEKGDWLLKQLLSLPTTWHISEVVKMSADSAIVASEAEKKKAGAVDHRDKDDGDFKKQLADLKDVVVNQQAQIEHAVQTLTMDRQYMTTMHKKLEEMRETAERHIVDLKEHKDAIGWMLRNFVQKKADDKKDGERPMGSMSDQEASGAHNEAEEDSEQFVDLTSNPPSEPTAEHQETDLAGDTEEKMAAVE